MALTNYYICVYYRATERRAQRGGSLAKRPSLRACQSHHGPLKSNEGLSSLRVSVVCITGSTQIGQSECSIPRPAVTEGRNMIEFLDRVEFPDRSCGPESPEMPAAHSGKQGSNAFSGPQPPFAQSRSRKSPVGSDLRKKRLAFDPCREDVNESWIKGSFLFDELSRPGRLKP